MEPSSSSGTSSVSQSTTLTRQEAISRLLATQSDYTHDVFGKIIPSCMLDSTELSKEEQESVLYACYFIIKANESAQKAITHMGCANRCGLLAARLLSSKRLHKNQLLSLTEKMSALIVSASELLADIDSAVFLDALDLPATINLSEVMSDPSCPNQTSTTITTSVTHTFTTSHTTT